jgi:hypothetical protein
MNRKLGRTIRSFHSSHFLFVRKPFLLADIGEGISEVELIQWSLVTDAGSLKREIKSASLIEFVKYKVIKLLLKYHRDSMVPC